MYIVNIENSEFLRQLRINMDSGSPGKGSSRKALPDSLTPALGKRIVAVWVALAVAIFLTIYLVTYQEKLRVDLDRVAHIRETLALVYDLENHLADAESGVRGYLLTGDEQQLARYQQAAKEMDRAFDDLYQQTIDDPATQRLLEELRPLIKKRQFFFQKSIDQFRLPGVEEQERQTVAREGGKLQDRIRKGLEKLEDAGKKSLNPELAQEKQRTRIVLWGLTGGALASFFLLFLVIYLLNQAIGGRKHAERQVAAYQENLRSLASSLSLAEERERRRLAVYLHDQIGNTLALTNIRLRELQKTVPAREPEFPREELEKIGGLLEQAISDTRSLTFKISSPILYELGLDAALEWLTEQVQNEHGIAVRFVTDGRPGALADDVKVTLFQAVGELLVNVVKHSQARNLEVSCRHEGGFVKIEVGDDGVGFTPPRTELPRGKRGGFGLFSICERLRPFGGRLEVQSAPGAGTHITLTVPAPDPGPPDKTHGH